MIRPHLEIVKVGLITAKVHCLIGGEGYETFNEGVYNNYLHGPDERTPAIIRYDDSTELSRTYYDNNQRHSYFYSYWLPQPRGLLPAYFYFIRGNKVLSTEYHDWLDKMGMKMTKLSEEDKLLIDIKWG